ncbi:type VI secretion system-associated protein TagF [Sphingomonas montana]|uniref:type VI secretion system-associated protein TagF n=1 Tax=Sphingomonas montana TaxID=1843236 RepID=UPI00096CC234|nr:type VI secretion system-associated protein TagF [Sphingomonas montana]
MSVEPLTAPAIRAVIGLTGKLPAHGDFVRRGDGPATARYDRWLAAALADAATSDREALMRNMAALPAWRFVAADDGSDVVAGALVASHDKVGRIYPLIGLAILPGAAHAQAEAWAAQAAAVLTAARDAGDTADALAAALSALPVGPDRDPAPPHTCWWRELDAIRLDGPATALPTGDGFARLLHDDDLEQGNSPT